MRKMNVAGQVNLFFSDRADLGGGGLPSPGRMRTVHRLLALALAAVLLPAAGRPEPDAALIYDLRSCGHGKWTMSDRKAVIAIDDATIALRANGGDRRVGSRLAFFLPLRDKAALGARDTRITLIWSAEKAGWVDGMVRFYVNRMPTRATSRPVQPAVAGERLALTVPAVAVRAADGLQIAMAIDAHQRGDKSQGRISIDALEVEVTP